MSVAADIALTWRSPRAGMARVMASGMSEERALAYLMVACGLFFIARIPMLQAAVSEPGAPPLAGLAAGTAIGVLLIAPLLFYGVAALSHIIARAVGGRGSWLAARVALFWSLLAAAPAVLALSALTSVVGPGLVSGLAGWGLGAVFLVIWIGALWEAECRGAGVGVDRK